MKEGDKLIPFPGGDLPPLPDQLIRRVPSKHPTSSSCDESSPSGSDTATSS